MNQLLALVCILASWDAAWSLSRPLRQNRGKALVTRFFLCGAIVLFAFHSLGFLQILSGWPALRIDLAAVLILAVAIATRLAASRVAPEALLRARHNVVYPSPMGAVQEEMEKWGIEYVFARSAERSRTL